MTTKKPPTFKYGKSFVSTQALKKYRDEHSLSNKELAEKIGESVTFVRNCIYGNRVPRAVLQNLGIKARNKTKNESAPPPHPPGGTIYACYVGAKDKVSFLAFCSALNINAKDVL